MTKYVKDTNSVITIITIKFIQRSKEYGPPKSFFKSFPQ